MTTSPNASSNETLNLWLNWFHRFQCQTDSGLNVSLRQIGVEVAKRLLKDSGLRRLIAEQCPKSEGRLAARLKLLAACSDEAVSILVADDDHALVYFLTHPLMFDEPHSLEFDDTVDAWVKQRADIYLKNGISDADGLAEPIGSSQAMARVVARADYLLLAQNPLSSDTVEIWESLNARRKYYVLRDLLADQTGLATLSEKLLEDTWQYGPLLLRRVPHVIQEMLAVVGHFNGTLAIGPLLQVLARTGVGLMSTEQLGVCELLGFVESAGWSVEERGEKCQTLMGYFAENREPNPAAVAKRVKNYLLPPKTSGKSQQYWAMAGTARPQTRIIENMRVDDAGSQLTLTTDENLRLTFSAKNGSEAVDVRLCHKEKVWDATVKDNETVVLSNLLNHCDAFPTGVLIRVRVKRNSE